MQWCLAAFILCLAVLGQQIPGSAGVPMSQLVPTSEKRGPLKSGDSIICLLCVDIIQQAKAAIKDPDLQKNVKDGFENGLCALFPGDVGTKCRTRVKIYAPLVFDILTSSFDPKTFCQDIALCSDVPTPIPPEKQSAVPILQSAVLLSSLYVTPLGADSSNPFNCDVCILVMKEVVNRLTSNTTEDAVIRVVESFCMVLPPGLKKMCWTLVHDFLDQAIKVTVRDLIRPQRICTILNFCSAGNKALLDGTVAAATGMKTVRKDDNTVPYFRQ